METKELIAELEQRLLEAQVEERRRFALWQMILGAIDDLEYVLGRLKGKVAAPGSRSPEEKKPGKKKGEA